MKQELTPEDVMEMGKIWGDAYLSSLSPEEVLKAVGPEDILKRLGPEERLRGLGPEERLRGLSVREIEAYLRKLKKKK